MWVPPKAYGDAPQRVKDELLKRYAYWNVDCIEWWDFLEVELRSDMAEIGFHVDKVFFSGFCSQGDGACFTGGVTDWAKLLKAAEHPHAEELGAIAEMAAWSATVSTTGRYSHSMSAGFNDFDVVFPCGADDEVFLSECVPKDFDEVRAAVLMAVAAQYQPESLEQALIEFLRSKMDDYYRDLETEYEHLLSEEAIVEALYDNELLDVEIKTIEAELHHEHV